VVDNYIAPSLVKELVDEGIRVTRLTSSGGFFRQGNTTLLSGVEDDEVQLVLQVIKDYVQKEKLKKIKQVDSKGDAARRQKEKIYAEGMATVFILPIEKMMRF